MSDNKNPRLRPPIRVRIVSKRKNMVARVSVYAPIFISVLALVATFWQACETREHDELSLTPSVRYLEESRPTSPKVRVFLVNKGIGPAILSQQAVFIDNQSVELIHPFDKLRQKIDQSFPGLFCAPPEWEGLGDGSMIGPGETIPLFSTTVDNITDIAAFRKLIEARLTIRIHAKSVYLRDYGDLYSGGGSAGLPR